MYAAQAAGENLTFDTECVWRRNMVIRDRETGTLWQHTTGEALVGPLKGEYLDLLGGYMLKWATWKNDYPDSHVALDLETWPGLLPRDFTVHVLEKATQGKTPPGLSARDERLPIEEMIIGFSVADEDRAYPLHLLQKVLVLEEQFAEKTIRLEYDPTSNGVSVLVNDEPISFQRTKWLGWFEFHPTTTIYDPNETG